MTSFLTRSLAVAALAMLAGAASAACAQDLPLRADQAAAGLRDRASTPRCHGARSLALGDKGTVFVGTQRQRRGLRTRPARQAASRR